MIRITEGMMTMYSFIVAVTLALAAGGGVSATATQPQRHFVPNCRVILFGEVLPQVPSDDGKLQGILFERTADAVLVNGRVWVSKDDKPKEPIRTEKYIESERRGAVVEEATRQFRAQYKKVGAASFVVGSQTYGETPQSYHVDRYDKSVTLAIKPGLAGMDYIFVTYEGVGVAEPLDPLPSPSQEEQDKVRLDNAYHGAVDDAKPGTIIFVTLGDFTPYPIDKAEAFINAMGKVPSLAVPVATDIYGEMAYRSLTVDGFFFDPQMVAVIMQRTRGR